MTLKKTYASITTTICAASHFNIIVWEYRYTVLLCVFTSIFNLFLLKNFFKGLVNLLSHDCHIDIDRDVSTAYCRSSSRDNVDLLSKTICATWLLVISVSRTSRMVGGFLSKASLALLEEETIPSQRSFVVTYGCYAV